MYAYAILSVWDPEGLAGAQRRLWTVAPLYTGVTGVSGQLRGEIPFGTHPCCPPKFQPPCKGVGQWTAVKCPPPKPMCPPLSGVRLHSSHCCGNSSSICRSCSAKIVTTVCTNRRPLGCPPLQARLGGIVSPRGGHLTAVHCTLYPVHLPTSQE
eukprot:scaffold124086_cov41-Cyclotella_meneghiniana.AAC.1